MKKKVLREILSWVWQLTLALVVAQMVQYLIFQPVAVKGESMSDTLKNTEVMYVSKLDYLLGDPGRGDVVVCRYPGRTEKFVKRVVALPGDTVEVADNVVLVNGEIMDEPYLTPWRNDDGFDMAPFALGEGEYFVMGDNRDNSHDSRNYYGYGYPAAIDREMILGRVRFVMYPFDSIRVIR